MKLRTLTAALCALLALLPPPASAAGTEGVSVRIDGRPLVTAGVASHIDRGTTYVPLTDFASAMGADSAWWDGTAATVSGDGMTIVAAPGENDLSVNGSTLTMTREVKLESGRTLVPVTALAEAYGLAVRWDGVSRTVFLTSDGQAPAAGYREEDLYWLSRIISAESRGEPLEGQIAVGNVVLNRVASPEFPDSIYEVIFDTRYGVQFEPMANGTIWQEPTASAVTAAKLALDGTNVVGNCLYFYNPTLSQSTWFDADRVWYATIGGHKFYL